MPIKADKSLRAYYNEIDPYAAQWIRNLMAEGWITKGDVDERSIEDVRPNELSGYDRLHFFAGVAVWDYALNQAGWGRSEIWTGSCPCQPFSAAGKGSGFADQRHLWPAFHHLIQECRPAIVLGEQVASKDADPWVNLVQLDLEAMGYGFGAVPFPAAGVGAPHIRDRLYWVADMHSDGCNQAGQCVTQAGSDGSAGDCAACGVADSELQQRPHRESGFSAEHDATGRIEGAAAIAGLRGDRGMADTTNERQHGWGTSQTSDGGDAARIEPERLFNACGVADTSRQRRQQDAGGAPCDEKAHGSAGWDEQQPHGDNVASGDVEVHRYAAARPTNGFWADADWLLCRDGKWRPVESGTFPLVAGPAGGMGRSRADWHTPAGKEGFGHRAGRLKGYGNAVNAEAARLFIECVMEGRA